MSESKIFRVTGEIVKPNFRTVFRKDAKAVKLEEVVEAVYKEMGSKHRAKRFEVRILKVEEISEDKIESPVLRKLTLGEREGGE